MAHILLGMSLSCVGILFPQICPIYFLLQGWSIAWALYLHIWYTFLLFIYIIPFFFLFCLVKERGKERERERQVLVSFFKINTVFCRPLSVVGWPERTFSQTNNHSISLFTGASCHLPITRECTTFRKRILNELHNKHNCYKDISKSNCHY